MAGRRLDAGPRLLNRQLVDKDGNLAGKINDLIGRSMQVAEVDRLDWRWRHDRQSGVDALGRRRGLANR
jgi:hypothetical protein